MILSSYGLKKFILDFNNLLYDIFWTKHVGKSTPIKVTCILGLLDEMLERLELGANGNFSEIHISISLLLLHCLFKHYENIDQLLTIKSVRITYLHVIHLYFLQFAKTFPLGILLLSGAL